MAFRPDETARQSIADHDQFRVQWVKSFRKQAHQPGAHQPDNQTVRHVKGEMNAAAHPPPCNFKISSQMLKPRPMTPNARQTLFCDSLLIFASLCSAYTCIVQN